MIALSMLGSQPVSAAYTIPAKGSAGDLTQVAEKPKETRAPLDDEAALQDLLERVYKIMDDHYYLPVSRDTYDEFVRTYTAARLKALNNKTRQTENFVHLGAGLLVNKLKSPTDKHTNFIPPTKVKEFKKSAYAVTENLGITGQKKDAVFIITKVERHAQAHEKGVRAGDQVLKIDGIGVQTMSQEEIIKKLTPVLGTKVRLEILFQATQKVL